VAPDGIRGTILFWPGTIATIPNFWRFTNGRYGTPDLRSQLLICAATDLSGDPAAIIDGAIAYTGGSINHFHYFTLGTHVIDSTPAGTQLRRTHYAYRTPPVLVLTPIFAAQGASMVPGLIALWHGTIATIPPHWVWCDGNNGTPDLRNRYVIGASADDAGVPKALINGLLAASGGHASHSHNLIAGTTILDASPAGTRTFTTDDAYNYPPTTALPFIMYTG